MVGLIRANGVVRERRIGEPWKDINTGPIPFPKIAEATSRVEKEEYSHARLRILGEAAQRGRSLDEGKNGNRATRRNR